MTHVAHPEIARPDKIDRFRVQLSFARVRPRLDQTRLCGARSVALLDRDEYLLETPGAHATRLASIEQRAKSIDSLLPLTDEIPDIIARIGELAGRDLPLNEVPSLNQAARWSP